MINKKPKSIAILSLVLLAAFGVAAQTRGAVAVTVSANSNLGDAQGSIGGMGTVETRKGKFGFAGTGDVGQLRKNSGGAGWSRSLSGEARYFFGNAFVSGGAYYDGYSVRKFSKSAAGVSGGGGVAKPNYTVEAKLAHDLSGPTRRNSFIARGQFYAPKKVLKIHPYFDLDLGVTRFSQGTSQTGVLVRIGVGVWF